MYLLRVSSIAQINDPLPKNYADKTRQGKKKNLLSDSEFEIDTKCPNAIIMRRGTFSYDRVFTLLLHFFTYIKYEGRRQLALRTLRTPRRAHSLWRETLKKFPLFPF